MWKKVVRVISVPLGAAFGVGAALLLKEGLTAAKIQVDDYYIAIGIGALTVIFGLLGFLFSPRFCDWMQNLMSRAESELKNMPLKELLLCVVGLIVGLIIAFFLGQAIATLGSPLISITANVVLYFLFAVLGIRVAMSRRDEVEINLGGEGISERAVVLDCSVIIDGRIVDVIELGFLSEHIIVPNFVLGELRRIADHEDVLKRARGRRGLDMLAKLQGMQHIRLTVDESNPEGEDIDQKLVKLAQARRAALVTNDYNLSKIGKMQNIAVLNVNDLSNAVKPVMLPGEELDLQIVKEGKEHGQGVAYLDDGTMIVVEGGKRYVAQCIRCVVTSVLQTSAGRMIFAKIKEEQ
ncbi:MAG: hypothetical protein KH354_03730 [Clostridiales bacterium]|nr:hypothetical protein [Clostridiales bacterium]